MWFKRKKKDRRLEDKMEVDKSKEENVKQRFENVRCTYIHR